MLIKFLSRLIFKLGTFYKEKMKSFQNILQLSMEKYSHIFLTHEIDLAAFVELTDSDLQEMGITKPQPRKQILEKIRKLKSKKFM